MLWDLIRDFIVTHITGGMDSIGHNHTTFMGNCAVFIGGERDDLYLASFNENFFSIGQDVDGSTMYINSADWLATILTIISLIFILVACVMFVVKMIKLVGNLVK